MKKMYLIWFCAAALLVAFTTKELVHKKPVDIANMDTTVKPSEDFFQYVNGGWIKNHPLPDDKSEYGVFNEMYDENELKLQDLVNEIKSKKQEPGSVGDKISKFYRTGMDSAAIEKAGLTPLKPEFERIQNIRNITDIQDQLSYFHSRFISSVFAFGAEGDAKNSAMVISYLYQGGLGLPDRDYYLSEDAQFAQLREKYQLHIANMFKLMGDDSLQARQSALAVFNIEKRLAVASMDRMTLRDPQATYHKMDIAALNQMSPAIDWVRYFEKLGIGNPGEVVVGQPDFFAELNKMVTEVPVNDWKNYFRWNIISDLGPYLNSAIVNERFDFYGKILSGIPKQRPRWKKVLNATNESLSEAIGQLYVAKYFPPQAKTRMLELVGNLKLALGERIQNLDWMSDTTKKNAQDKLAAMVVKIGYPDKWKDYSALEVKEDAYVLNMIRAQQFDFNDMAQKINKPVDRQLWHMPPQMVNAYYNPLQNEIVFPAAILQPPFFHLDGDDAVNYGAIGVVIGHEMTHGFDDQGRQYDKEGNLTNWWTTSDEKRFNERTKVLIKRFNQFVVLDTIHANGAYTLGENIADLGGLNIAYTAFKKTQQWKNQSAKIDGYTPDQRFFLAYGHVWAETLRNEQILQTTQTDVHSLGKFRVEGPLPNMPEFIAAFNVQPGERYFLTDSSRAKIW